MRRTRPGLRPPPSCRLWSGRGRRRPNPLSGSSTERPAVLTRRIKDDRVPFYKVALGKDAHRVRRGSQGDLDRYWPPILEHVDNALPVHKAYGPVGDQELVG